MVLVKVEKFDAMGNAAINRAINIANNMHSQKINVGHLLLGAAEVQSNLAEKFNKDTGVTLGTFKVRFMGINSVLEKLESLVIEDAEPENDRSNLPGYSDHELNQNREWKEIGLNDISESFDLAIRIMLQEAVSTNTNVTPSKMYDVLIRMDTGEIADILRDLGVDLTKLRCMAKSALESMPVTSQYAVDMCEMARDGAYDPVIARNKEISNIIEVLGRRQKGNPCLIGDPGVGKTAIIEGLAQRIVADEVPSYIRGKHIISVDISGVISGTKYRGEFEERFNNILYEAARNPDVILFFDEFHMLTRAGDTQDGAMTAANIMKPAISRGDVRVIGATTTKEWARFIESDGAFERRMQSIVIEEPSIQDTVKMLEKISKVYAKYHNCLIDNTVIEAATRMSDRYIQSKRLPDKAITVIDETAARMKAYAADGEQITLAVSDIRETISKESGVKLEDIDGESKNKLQRLDESLRQRIIGQNEAIDVVVKSIKRAKAGVKDPNHPIGSFMFVGPTGVGKTELTKVMTNEITGSLKNLLKFDMSEFMEKHTVSRLIGAPPGYVGFGEGGQLTEAVKRNPNSVILFDEIEKAHPDVFNILLQILDDGVLTDSKGTHVDFRNTIIIMTSNAGYGQEDSSKSIGFGLTTVGGTKDPIVSKSSKTEAKVFKALEETFRPEFLNRIDKVVAFNSLTKKDCSVIVDLEIKKIAGRVLEHGIAVTWDDAVTNHILEEGFSEKYGARNLKRKIQEVVEDKLADIIINEEAASGDSINLTYKDTLICVITAKDNGQLRLQLSEEKTREKQEAY